MSWAATGGPVQYVRAGWHVPQAFLSCLTKAKCSVIQALFALQVSSFVPSGRRVLAWWLHPLSPGLTLGTRCNPARSLFRGVYLYSMFNWVLILLMSREQLTRWAVPSLCAQYSHIWFIRLPSRFCLLTQHNMTQHKKLLILLCSVRVSCAWSWGQ